MFPLTPEAVSDRIFNLNTLGRAPIDVKARAIGEAEFLVLASGKLERTSPARLDLSAKFQALTEVLSASYERDDIEGVLTEFAIGLCVTDGKLPSFTYIRQIRDELSQIQGGMMDRLSIRVAQRFRRKSGYMMPIGEFTPGAEVLAIAVEDLSSFTGRERLSFGHKLVKAYAMDNVETPILRTRHVIGAVANRLQAQASVA